jgi:hypothetical protein
MDRLVKAQSSVQELFSFAVLLKAAGLGEEAVREVFEAARRELPDEDVKAEDTLCDTLDYITGNCVPSMRLFPEGDTPAFDPPK